MPLRTPMSEGRAVPADAPFDAGEVVLTEAAMAGI
jgi:hypothetical protein